MQFPFPVEHDVSLAARTTLGVGGPARWLVRCPDAAAVVEALAVARERGLPTLVLGGGSNMLVSDRGFDGLVLALTDQQVTIESAEGGARVTARAGAVWDSLVASTVAAGLGGLECLSGIPGWVGAAPIQNIGAYGQEIGQTLVAVDVVDRGSGERRRLAAAECGLGYRTSRFKGADRGRFVVLGVELSLAAQAAGCTRYGDVQRWFAGQTEPPSPDAVRMAVLDIRRGKSMVVDAEDPNSRSAGSFFVNPVVAPAVAEATRRRARAIGVIRAMPVFPVAENVALCKLSAAWLIEAAGFRRGHVAGRAGLSSRHALALINRGDARAEDVLALARAIRQRVHDRFGIVLQPEPVLVGFDADLDTVFSA